jgi:hypothetical protein
MAFNPLPTLPAVNYKGSGAVQVFPLIGDGTTLDTQDGDDVGSGGGIGRPFESTSATNGLPELEAPVADQNNQANRVVEAFGKRFVLHGLMVYERDRGGAGRYGLVFNHIDDPRNVEHTGLHVLYPNGIETVAFMFVRSSTLYVATTTDGENWTETNTALNVGTTTSVGASVVFRNAIFWRRRGSDSNNVLSYDFVLAAAIEYPVAGHLASDVHAALHVHLGELFYLAADSGGNDGRLWRLDGSVFNIVITFGAGTLVATSVPCMISDGFEIMVFQHRLFNTRVECYRVFDVLAGGSPSFVDKTTEVMGAFPLESIAKMYAYKTIHPSPLKHDARFYLFYGSGDVNSGSLDPYRYNYRVMPTSAHSGAFIVGEKVTGGTSGHEMIVTDIAVDTSLSGTDATGVFQVAETITGVDSGATATVSTVLDEVALTALGAGLAAANFGIVASTDGGLERVFTRPAARPVFNGLPTEVPGARRRPFEVNGTGADFNAALYYSKFIAGGAAPRERGTLTGISILETPVTTGLVGNLGEVAIEALSPATGDAYVVSAVDGDASLTPGAIAIQEGDIVEYDGANWVKVASGNQPLFKDLAGYWHLDDNGSDASGNGKSLTQTGAPAYAAGQFANGFDAPGANGTYLNRTVNDVEFNIGDAYKPWAVSFWVDADVLVSTGTILDKSNGATQTQGWIVQTSASGNVSLTFLGRNAFGLGSGALTIAAGMQHVLFTGDGVIWRGYVDGVELNTDSTFLDMVPNSNPLRIGNRNDNDQPFDGVIDDVAIWNRYITPAEVALIYNAGAGRLLNEYGHPAKKTHATLNGTTPLIAPYTDGVDEGKLVAFDGTSKTGHLITSPTIASNEAQGLTPSNGAVTYLLDHDATTDGIDTADRHTVMLDIA